MDYFLVSISIPVERQYNLCLDDPPKDPPPGLDQPREIPHCATKRLSVRQHPIRLARSPL